MLTHDDRTTLDRLRFDIFEANLVSGELRKDGIRLHLRDQSFRVLVALLQRAGEVVTREDLRELLWNGRTFVDFDNNLNAIVAHLREVLGDSAERPQFIETVPKRGYRFLTAVSSPRQHLDATLPTNNLLAYNEYVQGRCEMWNWTPASITKARKHFETALELDAGFALACDALANFFWYLGFWGFLPPDEAEPIRRFYVLRASELDPALAETQMLMAFHPEKCNHEDPYSYNWTETEQKMLRARNQSSNSVLVRVRYASVLLVLGRLEDAAQELLIARQLDRRSLEVNFWLGEIYFFARQYAAALKVAQQFVELEPEHHLPQMVLGHAYLGLGKFGESIRAFRRAAALSFDLPLMLGWLGLALGLAGQSADARLVLEQLRGIAATKFVLPSSFAWIHFGLGEVDNTFRWLDRALDRNDGWIPAIRSYSFLDSLHADPRFHALVRKLNLKQAVGA